MTLHLRMTHHHTVWLQKVEQFRRYLLDKAMTEGHKDMVISATHPPTPPYYDPLPSCIDIRLLNLIMQYAMPHVHALIDRKAMWVTVDWQMPVMKKLQGNIIVALLKLRQKNKAVTSPFVR